MKFKALRHKDTKKFIEIQNFGGVNMLFTSDLPIPLPMSMTMELLKKYHETQSPLPEEIDMDEYELAEFEMFECDIVGEDIRNNLGPIRNILSLIKLYGKEKNGVRKGLLKEIIAKEMKICYKSLRHLNHLL